MPYSVQSSDQIFVKGHGFLSFAKNMDKHIGKNIRKNSSGKCSQKRLDRLNNTLETSSKRAILKITEETGDLTKLQKSQKIIHRIIRRQLKVKQKYLKKDIYL